MNAELEKENAELREVHESDKRSLALIAKKSADFEKAYNETEELLDKQIEATYKLFEENKELKTRVENQKSFLERIRAKFNLGELERKEIEGYLTNEQLTKAKEIIRTLYYIIQGRIDYENNIQIKDSMDLAQAFLNEVK